MSKQSWDSKCAHTVRRQLILQYKRREKQNVGTEEGSNKNRLLTATIKKTSKSQSKVEKGLTEGARPMKFWEGEKRTECAVVTN